MVDHLGSRLFGFEQLCEGVVVTCDVAEDPGEVDSVRYGSLGGHVSGVDVGSSLDHPADVAKGQGWLTRDAAERLLGRSWSASSWRPDRGWLPPGRLKRSSPLWRCGLDGVRQRRRGRYSIPAMLRAAGSSWRIWGVEAKGSRSGRGLERHRSDRRRGGHAFRRGLRMQGTRGSSERSAALIARSAAIQARSASPILASVEAAR